MKNELIFGSIKISFLKDEIIRIENSPNLNFSNCESINIKNKKLESDNDQMNEKIVGLTLEKDRLIKDNNKLKDRVRQIQKGFNRTYIELKFNRAL